MEKKLPKVFANPIVGNIMNNKRVFYGEKETSIKEETKPVSKENINYKINKIFKSSKYIYKIDTEITTNEGTNKYQLIGKTSNNLITIENKLIPISEIIDIKEL